MVPALAGQYIILTKSTAIGAVVGLDETLRRAVILYNGYQNPLQSLFVAGCIYFVLLFSLSRLSRKLEPRQRTTSPRRSLRAGLLDWRRPAHPPAIST
jgi:ABC-type amino acid transport system permease subunit